MRNIHERIALGLSIFVAGYGGSAAFAGAPNRSSSNDASAGRTSPSGQPMPLGPPVDAPWGYVSLCNRSPVDCVNEDTPQARARAVLAARALARARWERAMQQRGMRPAVGAANANAVGANAGAAAEQTSIAEPWRIPRKAAWGTLQRINDHVNRTIRPADDRRVYGVSDWWIAPLSSGQAPLGDCKDYALEKRRELIAAGIMARALSMALVRTAWGEAHVVLVVATLEGDYVLDNLTSEIRHWSHAPYSWQARQSPSDPMVWLSVRSGLAH